MIIKLNDINEEEIIKNIKQGKIFIYPTDTIYGIGCDATNQSSVEKIREIKQRDTNPFSVIAPSKQWIKDNLEVDNKRLNLLPGPYTLILKLKNKVVSDSVLLGLNTLGIRIPNHKLTPIIQKSNLPFISTSVNLTGKEPITKISEISENISNKVDIIIDAGTINNPPSTLINIDGKPIKRNQNL
jgi:L-threonylcarbamoyladenylate synthase